MRDHYYVLLHVVVFQTESVSLTSVYYMSKINNTTDFKAITCCSVIDCTYILALAFPAFCLRYFPFFIASFSNAGVSLV